MSDRMYMRRSLFCTVMVFCIMLVAFLFFPLFRSSYGLLMLCGNATKNRQWGWQPREGRLAYS